MSSATNDWRALTSRRIYFGHQSVGQNLLDGVRQVADNLRLIEDDTAAALQQPGIAHSRIGKNRDPKSKIDAFAAVMHNGIGNVADIAFFKLCYVDVTADTDVHQLFNHYAKTMTALRSTYPRTTFMHVTVPLTIAPPVWRLLAGRVLNRPVHSVADNIVRNRYNDLVRRAYAGNEALFDLALHEVNGRGIVRGDARGHFWALDSRLTDDGGHLNAEGRRTVATAFLDCLTQVRLSDLTQDARRAS